MLVFGQERSIENAALAAEPGCDGDSKLGKSSRVSGSHNHPVRGGRCSCEAPQGSLLAFAPGNVAGIADATGICSITEQPSLSP